MSDQQLARDVSDELQWDPKVGSRDVQVLAAAGVVTLRGSVGSLWERQEARQAAQRVRGVIAVDNQLEVRFLDDDHRADADLRGDVLEALMLDLRVPTSVDAKVKDGVVTLTGPVSWWYQREEAESVAGNVPGVVDVRNEIFLDRQAGPLSPADVEEKIRMAFVRNAQLDSDAIHVATADRTVTLSGTVRSWDEHDAALAAAWAAPGVQVVDDRIEVTS